MANSPKKKQPPKGGGGCSFGCLGCPNPNYDIDTISNENSKPSLDDFISMVPKRRKWFIWARKKRAATKTVPLDAAAAMPEKPRRSWSCKDVNNMVIKREKKEKNISQPLINHVNSVKSPEQESTPAAQKTNRTRSNSDDKHIILGNKISSPKTTSICFKRNHTRAPPPLNRNDAATTTMGKAFDHSISLPLNYNKGKKLATTNSGGNPPIIATKKSKDTVVIVNRVDSVIGMSIILVMLLIMLMFGKVCAIFCTSAWFYFVPRFRVKKGLSKANKMDSSSSIVDQIDINSQEYKKKVVLEGLLDRNKHRKNVVSSSK
ncbi:hypothetical protein Leryth_000441 [Lithospermum erythrorhizon]|nr:hypothetical protein Leryth_000441 [Lithospermum erythrorhizon]